MTNTDLEKAIIYLENYVSDLSFQVSHGVDFVSYCTDATPEFDNENEAEAYITRIQSLIADLKGSAK